MYPGSAGVVVAFAIFVAIAATSMTGCAAAVPSVPKAPSPPPASLSAPPELTKHQRRAGFLPLTLLLPDAAGWATTRDEPLRYEAVHAPSTSRLVVESLDGSFGTSMYCALNDRSNAPAPSSRFDAGLVRAPLSLDVAYELFADELPHGAASGTVWAHAATGGRCFRIRFETRDRGDDAAAETAARLVFFRDVSLPSLLVVREGHGPAAARTSLERR